MAASIHTIGYEQSSVVEFIGRLVGAGVNLVVDVRAVPLSRKPGFSKSKLATALATNGIGYRHYVLLGAPRELRDRLRRGGNWTDYERGYLTHLDTCGAELQALRDLVSEQTLCLLCFERDPAVCHRRLVAERLAEGESDLVIQHIRY